MKIRVFTDGACSGNPGPGGWGAIVCMPNDNIELSGGQQNTTNNRMELLAVLESLKCLATKVKEYAFNRIEIYSDSAYVVNAINQKWLKKWNSNGWKTLQGTEIKNIDIWSKMHDILSRYKKAQIDVNFIKVKGHSGIEQNERVDKIAKKEVQKLKALC